MYNMVMKFNCQNASKCTIKPKTGVIECLVKVNQTKSLSPAFECGRIQIRLPTFERLGNHKLQPSKVFIKLRNAQITSIRMNTRFTSKLSSKGSFADSQTDYSTSSSFKS